MAGGIWTGQNKIRPGAYIQFKSVEKPGTILGTRGVAMMPVSMNWGGQIIELYGTDFEGRGSIGKIGYSVYDEEAQVYRELLKGCYKAYIYRLDKGGTPACATLGSMHFTAAYPGILGNEITIVVTKSSNSNGSFLVSTYFKGVVRDTQKIKTPEELANNDFVKFQYQPESGGEEKDGEIESQGFLTTPGLPLQGGENGKVTEESYMAFLEEARKRKWQTMAVMTEEENIKESVVSAIKRMRDGGKKVQAVLYDYPQADYEGIISVDQGYRTKWETISPMTFVATIAGMTAGAAMNESNTYKVIHGAIDIINAKTNEELEEGIQKGMLLISESESGNIVIEKDINTFVNSTLEKGYSFSKNRVIRCLDEINNTIKSTWENHYLGKVDNNDHGRNIFKGDVIRYLKDLEELGAIQNFDSAEDIKIYQGTEIDCVVVDLYIAPVDAMEKLYMTVVIG
ncbi:MAG: phage tail protein [Lachnospiraceae bacterium]|jgi:hypothetical protein|nr:phage tail protein [Lachnospiraceae bacterium]